MKAKDLSVGQSVLLPSGKVQEITGIDKILTGQRGRPVVVVQFGKGKNSFELRPRDLRRADV